MNEYTLFLAVTAPLCLVVGYGLCRYRWQHEIEAGRAALKGESAPKARLRVVK